MSDLQQLLTVRQAAELLAISVSTMRELVRVGEIAYIQKGRGTERKHMSFHPRDLEDFIKRTRTRESPTLPRKLQVAAVAPSEGGFMERRQARIEAKKAQRLAQRQAK